MWLLAFQLPAPHPAPQTNRRHGPQDSLEQSWVLLGTRALWVQGLPGPSLWAGCSLE